MRDFSMWADRRRQDRASVRRLVRALLPWLLVTGGFLSLTSGLAARPKVTRSVQQASVGTFILYDGAKGTLPDEQEMTFMEWPAGADQTLTDEGVILDTTGDRQIRAGYFGNGVPDLVRARTYTVTFTLEMVEEDHSGSDKDGDGTGDRAGFSLLVVGDDLYGIELGFWQDRIWAQEDGEDQPPNGSLFTQAEHAAFDTTGALIPYELVIAGDRYRLRANGETVLAGPLRNYSAFEGQINPYRNRNTLFMGDNTTSARGAAHLSYVAITIGPERLFVPAVWGLSDRAATGAAEQPGTGAPAPEKQSGHPCR